MDLFSKRSTQGKQVLFEVVTEMLPMYSSPACHMTQFVAVKRNKFVKTKRDKSETTRTTLLSSCC